MEFAEEEGLEEVVGLTNGFVPEVLLKFYTLEEKKEQVESLKVISKETWLTQKAEFKKLKREIELLNPDKFYM